MLTGPAEIRGRGPRPGRRIGLRKLCMSINGRIGVMVRLKFEHPNFLGSSVLIYVVKTLTYHQSLHDTHHFLTVRQLLWESRTKQPYYLVFIVTRS